MFSWFGSEKILSRIFCVSKRLCRESLRAFRHGGVERKGYSNEATSQDEEGRSPVFERCDDVTTTSLKFNLFDYHKARNILFSWCCFSFYA